MQTNGDSNMDSMEYLEKIEFLEIQLRHLENDLILTKEENERTKVKFIEIVQKLKEKNSELQLLKQNLEKIVRQQTNRIQQLVIDKLFKLLHKNSLSCFDKFLIIIEFP